MKYLVMKLHNDKDAVLAVIETDRKSIVRLQEYQLIALFHPKQRIIIPYKKTSFLPDKSPYAKELLKIIGDKTFIVLEKVDLDRIERERVEVVSGLGAQSGVITIDKDGD